MRKNVYILCKALWICGVSILSRAPLRPGLKIDEVNNGISTTAITRPLDTCQFPLRAGTFIADFFRVCVCVAYTLHDLDRDEGGVSMRGDDINEQADKNYLLHQKTVLGNQMASISNRLYRLENRLRMFLNRMDEPVNRVMRAHYQSLIQMQQQMLSYTWKLYKQVQDQLKRLE
ncbi:hypothetical protein [Nibrella saemangeumensis]